MNKNLDIHMRPATQEDGPMLAEFGARTFTDTYAAYNTPENMAFYLREYFAPDVIARELADPSLIYRVAEIDGVPAGYIKLKTGPHPSEVGGERGIGIARLYAGKEWHGQGVGPALMQAVIDIARSRDFDTIWLGVWKQNPRAVAFYRKWGFEIVGEEIFQFGDDPQEDFLMARPVSGQ